MSSKNAIVLNDSFDASVEKTISREIDRDREKKYRPFGSQRERQTDRQRQTTD